MCEDAPRMHYFRVRTHYYIVYVYIHVCQDSFRGASRVHGAIVRRHWEGEGIFRSNKISNVGKFVNQRGPQSTRALVLI